MDRSDVAYLIVEKWTQDEYLVQIPERVRRLVYVQAHSVSAREWFDGGRAGLNPEVRLTMFSGDYHGEAVVEFHGTMFTVYRTYQTRNDTIELYLERRKGAENGQEENPAP